MISRTLIEPVAFRVPAEILYLSVESLRVFVRTEMKSHLKEKRKMNACVFCRQVSMMMVTMILEAASGADTTEAWVAEAA